MVENSDLQFWHRMPDGEVFEAGTEHGEGLEERLAVNLGAVLNAEAFEGERRMGYLCAEELGIDPAC